MRKSFGLYHNNYNSSSSTEDYSRTSSDLDIVNDRSSKYCLCSRYKSSRVVKKNQLLLFGSSKKTLSLIASSTYHTNLNKGSTDNSHRSSSKSPSRAIPVTSKNSVIVLYHGKSLASTLLSDSSFHRTSKSEHSLVESPVQNSRWRNSTNSIRRTGTRRQRCTLKHSEQLNIKIFRESEIFQFRTTSFQDSFLSSGEPNGLGLPKNSLTVELQKSVIENTCVPSQSEAMANHANQWDQRREGVVVNGRKSSQNFTPNLGFLMQHMHMHARENTDIPRRFNNAPQGDDLEAVFPLRSTPSGNLKIIQGQCIRNPSNNYVPEVCIDAASDLLNCECPSKTLEYLWDRPRTHILSSKTMGTPEPFQGILKFWIDTRNIKNPRLRRCKLQGHNRSPGMNTEYQPKTKPYKVQDQLKNMDEYNELTSTLSSTHIKIDEVLLSSLDLTTEQTIDWGVINLPGKTELYEELARRITNYKNADCVIRLGNDEFHCHLLVLQCYSAFFDEKNCQQLDLSNSNVTSRAFSIIYDWMISPSTDSCQLLRRDNILEVFLAAQYLGIKELEEQCWAFIDNDELFAEDTAFSLYVEAKKIDNTAVMELMIPRIMKFFLILVGTKDFLELSFDELCSLLKSNYISVNSEIEVLMSAVRWLMASWEERKRYMLDVLKCVRFGLIAPWQLIDVKRNPENPEFMELMSYPDVQKMVDDGLAFVIIKYWYGNRTEDYYHWIDLLGLTEPTNRNWAGEDKNYVTYREFLIYLEEYQKTRITELKNRKARMNRNRSSPPLMEGDNTGFSNETRPYYHQELPNLENFVPPLAREPNISKKENNKHPVDIPDNRTHFPSQFISENKKSFGNGLANMNNIHQRVNNNNKRTTSVLSMPGSQ